MEVTARSIVTSRPERPVESAGYFAVAELPANLAKHARATEVTAEPGYGTRMLTATVPTTAAAAPEGSGLAGSNAERPLRWPPRDLHSGRRPNRIAMAIPVRVVIAEDLFLLRDGLVRLVETHGHTVVEAVNTRPATLAALLAQRPDVATVDVRLPPTFSDEGQQAAHAARRKAPGLPADGRGGIGYQLKDRVLDADQFMDALRRVADGGTALNPAVVAKLLGRPTLADPPRPRARARAAWRRCRCLAIGNVAGSCGSECSRPKG